MSQQEAQETVDKMKVTLKTSMHTFHGIDTLGNKLGGFFYLQLLQVFPTTPAEVFAIRSKKHISK